MYSVLNVINWRLRLLFSVFPRAVHRRDGVATAQRGPLNRHHEHEVGTGAQIPCGFGSEAGQLRGMHALRTLSWCSVARRQPAQSQSGSVDVGSVLSGNICARRCCRHPKVRPPQQTVFLTSFCINRYQYGWNVFLGIPT